MSKLFLRTAIIGAAGLALALRGGGTVSASQACKPIQGHFEASLVLPPECASPVGLCTAGRLWGGLSGAYAFTMSQIIPPGEPDVPTIVFFTGRSTITLHNGDTLTAVDTGSIDLPPGAGGFASLITFTGGTGEHAGATGQLRVTGQLDAAAGTTSGDFSGALCTP